MDSHAYKLACALKGKPFNGYATLRERAVSELTHDKTRPREAGKGTCPQTAARVSIMSSRTWHLRETCCHALSRR